MVGGKNALASFRACRGILAWGGPCRHGRSPRPTSHNPRLCKLQGTARIKLGRAFTGWFNICIRLEVQEMTLLHDIYGSAKNCGAIADLRG